MTKNGSHLVWICHSAVIRWPYFGCFFFSYASSKMDAGEIVKKRVWPIIIMMAHNNSTIWLVFLKSSSVNSRALRQTKRYAIKVEIVRGFSSAVVFVILAQHKGTRKERVIFISFVYFQLWILHFFFVGCFWCCDMRCCIFCQSFFPPDERQGKWQPKHYIWICCCLICGVGILFAIFIHRIVIFTYSEIVARQISLSIGFLDSSEQHLHMYSWFVSHWQIPTIYLCISGEKCSKWDHV